MCLFREKKKKTVNCIYKSDKYILSFIPLHQLRLELFLKEKKKRSTHILTEHTNSKINRIDYLNKSISIIF